MYIVIAHGERSEPCAYQTFTDSKCGRGLGCLPTRLRYYGRRLARYHFPRLQLTFPSLPPTFLSLQPTFLPVRPTIPVTADVTTLYRVYTEATRAAHCTAPVHSYPAACPVKTSLRSQLCARLRWFNYSFIHRRLQGCTIFSFN